MKKKILTLALGAALTASLMPAGVLAGTEGLPDELSNEQAATKVFSDEETAGEEDSEAAAGDLEICEDDPGDSVEEERSGTDGDARMAWPDEEADPEETPDPEPAKNGIEAYADFSEDIMLLALPASNKQIVRWTYSDSSYTEFYVAAYDKDTEEELSFDISYSITDPSEEVTIDLSELTGSISDLSDGAYEYGCSYATVYGIDYDDNGKKSDENYWQILGSQTQPVTKLVITHTQMSRYAMWGYSAYSGDDCLGTINVRAHDDSTYPYIYLQLWCERGDAFPAVAENVDTGLTYLQLDAAISEAGAGDTIRLLSDLDVEMTKTDQFKVDKDLTLDLNEKTIMVSGSNASYRLFTIASGVEATFKNGSIDGGDQKASGNAIYGNGASSALTEVVLEDLTIQNFGSAANYGTVYVYDGSLTASDCQFLDNGNSAITLRSSSGDANLYDGTALTLDGCKVSGNENSTNNYGGGVGVRQISKVSISGSTISDNQFESTPGGIYGGGGVILYNIGEIALQNNEITDNESSEYGGGVLILSGAAFGLGDKTTVFDNTITGNTAQLNGGGLTYYINTEAHEGDAYCTFNGNTIEGNYSAVRGGGMSMYSNDPDFTFTIFSGNINNNRAADSGGGIDFAWERPATLQLYNALITENNAAKGGGIWLCPTSETIMHVTFGGAIYGNDASESDEVTESCGDEIRFEGDKSGDSDTGMIVNVASRALGGTLMDWYTDEYGARYRDGSGTLIDVTSPEYTDRTEALSLHGELSESGAALAKAEAVTIISNNEAEQGYGGGIASNAVLEFGEEDTELTVVKEWVDEDGEKVSEDFPADSIEVTLVRVSEDGSEADLETITLSEENEWTWTFEELPGNFTYEVREETQVPGYTASYESAAGEEGSEQITITNRPKPDDPVLQNGPGPEIDNPDDGNPDDGSPNDGNPNKGNPNDGNPNTGNPDVSSPNGSNPNNGNPDSSNPSSAGGSKTGDTNMTYLWIILIIAAAALIAGAAIKRTRRS